MADTKISALAALTALADEDLFVVVDDPAGTPITKKVTMSNMGVTGTFTPVCAFATPGTSTWSASTQIGRYVKIGRLCFIYILYVGVPTNGTASGNLELSGLPFTTLNLANTGNPQATMMGGWTKANYTWVIGLPVLNTTLMRFQAGGSGQTASILTTAEIPTGGTVGIRTSGMYETA